jgi:hypothetical protein
MDVVNTQLKANQLLDERGRAVGLVEAHRMVVRQQGVGGLFSGLLPRMAIIGMGSTVFWFWYGQCQHMLAGTHTEAHS